MLVVALTSNKPEALHTAAELTRAPSTVRQRRRHSKTRTGCLVCKSRRVKCDETKPSCAQCLRLKFICEYGALRVWLFEPKSAQKWLGQSPSTPNTNSDEMRAMQYFQEMTIPLLSRFSSTADLLFSRVVLQLGESDPAIKHQLVALASMQEKSQGNSASVDGAVAMTIQHYRKALRLLADQSQTPEVQVILVSCLISIALENLRDDSETSFFHLESGLRILREWKAGERTTGVGASQVRELIEIYIEPVYAQLEATAGMTGSAGSRDKDRGTDLQWARPQMPESFGSFPNAREKFYEIGHWIHIQNRLHPLFRRNSPQYDDIDQLYQQWKEAFKAYAESTPHASQYDRLEQRTLQAFYQIHYSAFTSQAMPETEIPWDEHLEKFREVIKTAESIFDRDDVYDQKAYKTATSFCRDPGLLPLCWQTAINCRDSTLRRRALELIGAHHRRCGHTDDCSAAAVAAAVMDMEEEGLHSPSCSEVDEYRRVRPLEADLTQPHKLIFTYTRSPYTIPETVELPLHQDTRPAVLPFRLFPMGETVRLAGYQGLVRKQTNDCRCKSYGIR